MQRQEAARGTAMLGPAGEDSVGEGLDERVMSTNCLPLTSCILVNRKTVLHQRRINIPDTIMDFYFLGE